MIFLFVGGTMNKYYLLVHAGIFLALSWPGFFRSTRLGFRVTQPAVCRDREAKYQRVSVFVFCDIVISWVMGFGLGRSE